MIRVLIVSDINLFREGLAEVLNLKDSICIVGTAFSVECAIPKICQLSPDVILVDMTMIACSEVIGNIASSCLDKKIIALAVTEDEDTILACAKAGIAGYVSREATIDQLVNTIRGVLNGEHYCPRRIAAMLFQKIKSSHDNTEPSVKMSLPLPDEPSVPILTRREKQIALQIIDGLSNKQIARSLSIEISTVKNHVHNILVKMGVGSRMQAANLLSQYHAI